MPTKVTCPNAQCGRVLEAPEHLAGHRAKCPHCGSMLPLPNDTELPTGGLLEPPSGLPAVNAWRAPEPAEREEPPQLRKPRKRSKGWWAAVVVGPLIAAIIIGGYVWHYHLVAPTPSRIGKLDDVLEWFNERRARPRISFSAERAGTDVLHGRELYVAHVYRDASKRPTIEVFFDKEKSVRAVTFLIDSVDTDPWHAVNTLDLCHQYIVELTGFDLERLTGPGRKVMKEEVTEFYAKLLKAPDREVMKKAGFEPRFTDKSINDPPIVEYRAVKRGYRLVMSYGLVVPDVRSAANAPQVDSVSVVVRDMSSK